MKYVVFDLEATCWSTEPPNFVKEIIEIGAFKLDQYGEVLDSFQRFVRPTLFPILSPFCSRLTTIDQSEIDNAETLVPVMNAFADWIDIDNGAYLLCSWGSFDQTLLRDQMRRHDLDTDWIEDYFDLKSQYHDIRRLPRKRGLKATIRNEGLEFTGQHHRALDDAENLTRIFRKYMGEWWN